MDPQLAGGIWSLHSAVGGSEDFVPSRTPCARAHFVLLAGLAHAFRAAEIDGPLWLTRGQIEGTAVFHEKKSHEARVLRAQRSKAHLASWLLCAHGESETRRRFFRAPLWPVVKI